MHRKARSQMASHRSLSLYRLLTLLPFSSSSPRNNVIDDALRVSLALLNHLFFSLLSGFTHVDDPIHISSVVAPSTGLFFFRSFNNKIIKREMSRCLLALFLFRRKNVESGCKACVCVFVVYNSQTHTRNSLLLPYFYCRLNFNTPEMREVRFPIDGSLSRLVFQAFFCSFTKPLSHSRRPIRLVNNNKKSHPRNANSYLFPLGFQFEHFLNPHLKAFCVQLD